jgi:Concanavalin A-like lectin/glucanases superfamily/Chitobiase/beta-hexosaminidase C-terminal domain/Family of unknown function (DUF6298)
MSKHLLYCKDLLNRALTRSFRLVLSPLVSYALQNHFDKVYRAKTPRAQRKNIFLFLGTWRALRLCASDLFPDSVKTRRKSHAYIPNLGVLCAFARAIVFCLIVLIQVVSPAEAAGPLTIKPTHPRYFFDSKGKSVYLTGSYLNEYNTLDGSWDFTSYLDFLQQQKQNFTRVWGWEQSPWVYDKTGEITFSTQPYERTGPGLALDGAPRFDLTRFNQAYFDQLRSRVAEAARRGIYVSVMLFEGFSTQKKVSRVNPWLGDPFQQANNINGINGDPNQDGRGDEFFSLAFPPTLALQEAFARKVADTLNDLDNVLYEVSGNGSAESLPWQYHMIDYIKRYQEKKANQQPVGISDFDASAIPEVFNSSADWIVIQETNPLPAASNKVLIMEGIPPVSDSQTPSSSPISLVQLLPDNVVSTKSLRLSSNGSSSNGVTPISSSATATTLSTTQSLADQPTTVATPTMTPNGGVFSNTVAVTLQTTTPGASIYYTTDGQLPTQSSRRYNGKFTLSGSTLVKAKAFKNNFQPSSEASAWFADTGAVSTPGLLAYWTFDEGSGTTAADSSNNGYSGTLVNGPIWTAGRIAGALSFDGVDDYVSFASQSQGTISISAWVYAQAASGNLLPRIIDMPGYVLYLAEPGASNPMSLGFLSRRSTQDGKWTTPANSLAYDTWNHVAVAYDSSSALNNPDLYINGVKQTISPITPPQGTQTLNGGTGIIGNRIPLDRGWKGIIDDLRVYNRTLSATEIQTLYQQAAPSQTVATPVISPNGGNYSGPVSVAMQTTTVGASIYYTTDGSIPTQLSTLYSGAMTLTNSATVKVKAFKSGYNASAEASASFTVTQPFSFSVASAGNTSVVAGSSVTNLISTTLASGTAQAVTFSASGLPAGATPSFSSTSCSPSCSSTLTINTTSSTPAGSSNITVTATGGGASKTTAFSLTVSLPTPATVATPTITPNGGSFTSSVSVTMQTATSGASIYYTTDGSAPTQSSTLYTGAMALTSNAVVKAKAFKSGSNASAEASASFTVTQPFSFSVSSAGNISAVAGSSVTNSISTTLTSGTAKAVTFSASGLPTGATASFSSTSCSPSCSSTLTINTSSSTAAGSSNITVTATGGGVSKTTTFSLTVSLATVATPAQLFLSWGDTSTNEANFQIERKTGTNGTYVQIALVSADVTSYVDSNLIDGTTYCYRVSALNSAGTSGYSNEACDIAP